MLPELEEELLVLEEKLEKAVDHLSSEYVTVRAGRANPHVLDKLAVDYYGVPTPIQQAANISVPEARMIQIQPWEKSMLKAIEKAILTSDIGINPTNDGSCIRLVFPELTEERRKELAKDVKKKGEGAKVAVRNIRRDGNVAFKKLKGALPVLLGAELALNGIFTFAVNYGGNPSIQVYQDYTKGNLEQTEAVKSLEGENFYRMDSL